LQILKRGDHLRVFIRHGQKEAKTEITLSSGSPAAPYVIERTFNKEPGSTAYKLNGGSHVNEQQWTNPCQALCPLLQQSPQLLVHY